MLQAKKAARLKTYWKALLMGASKTGRTTRALQLAQTLAQLSDSRIVVIDTEFGRTHLLADVFDFDVYYLPDNAPDTYVEAIDGLAVNYKVIVVDGFTAAWAGDAGVLDIADAQDWKIARPAHNKLVKCIHEVDAHLIGIVRIGEKYDALENVIGIKAHQEKGFEYEWHTVMHTSRKADDYTVTVAGSNVRDIKAGLTIFGDDQIKGFADTAYHWANQGDARHWTDNRSDMKRVHDWLEADAQKANFKAYGKRINESVGAMTDYDTAAAYCLAVTDAINACHQPATPKTQPPVTKPTQPSNNPSPYDEGNIERKVLHLRRIEYRVGADAEGKMQKTHYACEMFLDEEGTKAYPIHRSYNKYEGWDAIEQSGLAARCKDNTALDVVGKAELIRRKGNKAWHINKIFDLLPF